MLKPEDFAADELSTGTRRHLAGSAAMRVSSKTIATRACNLESLGMLPCSSVNLRRAAQGTATDRADENMYFKVCAFACHACLFVRRGQKTSLCDLVEVL